MGSEKKLPLLLAVTGASGIFAAKILLQKAPWPVVLISSRWAREVYELECESFNKLAELADTVYDEDDLTSPFSSGSVPCRAMVILPCSSNTLAAVASGLADNLITRAAHCQLKEKRPLVLVVRETPWTRIDMENALRVYDAGATVMPLCPPFYMLGNQPAEKITLEQLMGAFAERILQFLGVQGLRTWEDVR